MIIMSVGLFFLQMLGGFSPCCRIHNQVQIFFVYFGYSFITHGVLIVALAALFPILFIELNSVNLK